MQVNLEGLLWLLLLLGPLLLLQRSLHREIQVILLLLTRSREVALALFSLLFFPGVLLHEGSHYLMARLLGVRTGRFSLIPHPLEDGRLQLGYVETARADWVRDALIGMAPLLAGGAFVAYAGLKHLGLGSLWQGSSSADLDSILGVFSELYRQPDFWLWFYFTLTVSSMMMPSASDRRAWLPLVLIFALLLGLSLWAGAGPWLVENLASPLSHILQAVAIIFGISALVHLAFLPPTWLLSHLLEGLMGVRIR